LKSSSEANKLSYTRARQIEETFSPSEQPLDDFPEDNLGKLGGGVLDRRATGDSNHQKMFFK